MTKLDPIQNNCKYGYVLPDRCRYNSITGCDCGAYPPVNRLAEEIKEMKQDTMDCLDGPEQEASMCKAQAVYYPEWKGSVCGCEEIQGNFICKLNPY